MNRHSDISTATRFLLVLGCLLSVAPGAAAQGDDMARAREAFSRGQELFDAEDYADALKAFDESLVAFPHFRTIFNIALCHEKLGDIARAVEMYRRFVDWPSEVPNREEVRAKIRELEQLLPRAPKPEAEPEPAPPADDEEPGPHPPQTPAAADPGPDLRLPGWIAIGAGAAGLVSGGVLLGLAQKRASEIAAVDGVPYDPAVHDQLPREGSRFEIAGWVAGGAGLAFIAAGLTMLLVSRTADEDNHAFGVEVVGFALPVQGGLACGMTGRF